MALDKTLMGKSELHFWKVYSTKNSRVKSNMLTHYMSSKNVLELFKAL